MPDYLVDLDVCTEGPGTWDYQVTIAFVADSREQAAKRAITMFVVFFKDWPVHDITAESVEGPFEPAELLPTNHSYVRYEHDWRDPEKFGLPLPTLQ